jgi:hypothetical protein
VDEGVILDFQFVAIYYRQYKGTVKPDENQPQQETGQIIATNISICLE